MVEDKSVSSEDRMDNETSRDEGVDVGRRAALRNLGALAGAAPAVAMLLSPSASRAQGSGGSPCESDCAEEGFGRGPGAPGTQHGGQAGFLGRRQN